MNPQIRFGEDLMSRVSYVMDNPDSLGELTGAVRAALDVGAEEAAKHGELVSVHLIPFPYAIHNHQLVNAQGLERDGAAIVIKERALTVDNLATTTLQLLSSPEQLGRMAKRSRGLAAPDAARNIVDIMLRILKEAGHTVA